MASVQTEVSNLHVLLLGGRDIYPGLHERLGEQGISAVALPVADFTSSMLEQSNVAAAVIDLSGLNEGQLELANGIVSRLTARDIAVIIVRDSLEAGSPDHPLVHRLDHPDLDMLMGMIIAHVAVRRRHCQAVRTGWGMTEQLKMAGIVQRDFLPHTMPQVPGINWGVVYRPAEWVSGDFYDITRLDEDHIGFYIADAVGHSMPAALLTMFIKQAIVMRETTGNTWRIYEPAEVIARLNEKMADQCLSGCQFATVCYCLLNIRTRRLTFSRAGHPHPIIVRNGKPEIIETAGPLLGVFRNSRFVQHTLALEPGDKILLYSDGAESIVSSTDDCGQFAFTPSFQSMARLGLGQMIELLDGLAASCPFPPGQEDDVSALGMEIAPES